MSNADASYTIQDVVMLFVDVPLILIVTHIHHQTFRDEEARDSSSRSSGSSLDEEAMAQKTAYEGWRETADGF